ncbi:NAD-dependent epimerase/dehydratase family protein [Streptomyces varsoviensis]|uniref:NAD-dependent epimerase/dehydratase family protein n=1 Tax=Streptomyces varsoviensis TaxID=67373 RepID=UPI000690C065|nr:NAD(P)-dependent oxidoreductase [Streptomyces varsoviensis]
MNGPAWRAGSAGPFGTVVSGPGPGASRRPRTSGPGGPARAVVFGGTGFVGRHVCAALHAYGYAVTAVSRGAARTPPGVRHVRAELGARPDAVAALLDRVRPQLVVNAAGAVWDAGPAEMDRVNADAVTALTAALAGSEARTRLVQLGSVHEYGPVPAGRCLDERTPTAPLTPYGRGKLLGSTAVLDARADGRLDAVVLRLSNAVGPGAPRSSLLGMVAGRLAAGIGERGPVVLRLSPLTAHRDFIDVRDIADAVVAAAAAPQPPPVLNIGRGRAVPVAALVRSLIAVSGVRARVAETVPDGGAAARGAGHEWQRVDITAATAALGWRPGRLLEEALHALWEESRVSQGRRPTV